MGKWTRRGLITAGVLAGGVFAVGVAIRPGRRQGELAPLVAGEGEAMVNDWVLIGPDNVVTAVIPHSEMGQGVHTALTQMLADELDADWSMVRIREAPAEDAYANYALGRGYILGDTRVPKSLDPTIDGLFLQVGKAMHLQITGGSNSVRNTGRVGMRVAGAAARQMLREAAAEAWGVPVQDVVAAAGRLLHPATGREATYGQFAPAAGARRPPVQPTLKRVDEFRIMGTSVPRRDIPAKVDGSARFGIDAVVEGMKYAAVVNAPVFGAVLTSVDADEVSRRPGVHAVVTLKDAVAVVADGWWQAQQAVASLRPQWSATEADSRSSEALYKQFDASMAQALEDGREERDEQVGDARGVLANAARVVEATYRVPFLAHACMEPMNATVALSDGACEVWLGSQNPLGTKHDVAAALGIAPETVRVHNHYMGGGFGRRSQNDVAIQAALIAREAGVPVKLIWSREEDIRHDHYRPAVTSRFRAGIAADGRIVAWENQFVDKHEPVEAPLIPYAVANRFVHFTSSPTHVPFGPWRSVDHSQHGFFTEAFFDEVAAAVGRDPYELRRELLADKPRHLAVLDLAAGKAGWTRPREPGHGRGIALQQSFGSIVATVAEVAMVNNRPRVERVVCAVDAGYAVTPDGLSAQMESGILYGLTAALYGEISIDNGAVLQSNFHDYRVVRMDEAPVIEVHILNSGAPMGGGGEPGTPGIAPAVANAIFDATGHRIRELPISRHDFDYRVEEREA
ncbi:MAG: xanthine dehydrogenase family protein molybdopterin-binding subunit [Pseudomonadales bacterium]|nr:xanthine dehydrogenase family protein molybdopterin-binding subunit [Pseudomonadales bacterium]